MFHRKGLQIMEPSSGNKDIVDYGGMVDILYLHGLVVEIPPTLTLSKNKAQIKNNAIDYTRQVTIPKEITPKQICYLRLRS